MRSVHKHWAAQKPWETAVPVAQANRQWGESVRASGSLDDLDDRVRSWSEGRHYRPRYSRNEQAVRPHVTVKETARLAQVRTRR